MTYTVSSGTLNPTQLNVFGHMNELQQTDGWTERTLGMKRDLDRASRLRWVAVPQIWGSAPLSHFLLLCQAKSTEDVWALVSFCRACWVVLEYQNSDDLQMTL